MKERFKSILLISLVVISFLFTKRLWTGLPNEAVGAFSEKDQVFNTSYLVMDMIAPNKYLLNFNKNQTLFYDDSKYNLWANTKASLAKVLSSKNINMKVLSRTEFATYNSSQSIVFNFPEKVNTYILAKALGIKSPNNIVDTIPNIDSIYVYLGKGDPFFVFSYKGKDVAVYDSTIDVESIKDQVEEIEKGKKYNYYASMKDTIGTDKDIYIPYEMKNNLPTIYVENEIRMLDDDNKRSLAERFLNRNIDYIREITESNGSAIYVHGQKVLKLNTNGTLEYTNPLEEIVKKRNLYESMDTAAKFISENAGVPKEMYLNKIDEIEEDGSIGYKLTFKYRIRGIPVILGNREVVDFVEVEVFNNHIKSYKHFIRKDMNLPLDNITIDKKMLSSLDVIDINYDFLFEKQIQASNDKGEEIIIEDLLSSIEDITMAYFDPCLKDKGDQLVGVWLIRTNEGIFAFDVYKGNLVYEKK